MFNNPFDSFHDTVAKAKEEREELDRLLTISTPSERVLVGAIAVFMLVLAAWLFLGSVSGSVTVWGAQVERVEGPSAGNRSLQAVAWIDSDLAAQIVAGLPITIELITADGATSPHGGEVVNVSSVPSPEGVPTLDLQGSHHRIEIVLDEDLDAAPLAGALHNIIIEIEQSPAALFGLIGH